MRITYNGPSTLTFPTIGLQLEPGVTTDDLTIEDVQHVRAQVGDELLTFLDGRIVTDECPTCHHVTVRLEEVEPPRQGRWLTADFDGTVTTTGTRTSYEFRAGEEFEVAPEDVDEITGLDLGDLSIVDPEAVPPDVSSMLKADLVELAGKMGLDDTGRVAELRERIVAAQRAESEPEPVEETALVPAEDPA